MPFVLALSQVATLSVQPEEARRVGGQRKGQLQRLFPFFPSLGTSNDWNHPLHPFTTSLVPSGGTVSLLPLTAIRNRMLMLLMALVVSCFFLPSRFLLFDNCVKTVQKLFWWKLSEEFLLVNFSHICKEIPVTSQQGTWGCFGLQSEGTVHHDGKRLGVGHLKAVVAGAWDSQSPTVSHQEIHTFR